MPFVTSNPMDPVVHVRDGLIKGTYMVKNWTTFRDTMSLCDKFLYEFIATPAPITPSANEEQAIDMLTNLVNGLSSMQLTAISTDHSGSDQTITIEFAMSQSVYYTGTNWRSQTSPPTVKLSGSAQGFIQQLQGYTVSPSQARQMMGFPDNPITEWMMEQDSESTECFVGYRDFDIDVDSEGVELMSRNGAYWPHRKPLRAFCINTQGFGIGQSGQEPFKGHDAPHQGCQCGIYAYSTPADPHLQTKANVWGEILLWGEVFVCEYGFRAEYAYPKALFVRDVGTKTVKWIRDTLEEAYGVPTELVESKSGRSMQDILVDHLLKGGREVEGGDTP